MGSTIRDGLGWGGVANALDGMTARLKNKQIEDADAVFSRAEDILKPISFIVSKTAKSVLHQKLTSVFQIVFIL